MKNFKKDTMALENGRFLYDLGNTSPITAADDITDGFHTFGELYHHRAVLFAVVCKAFPQFAWKAKAHADGNMFPGMFIVGLSIPGIGQATYHYYTQDPKTGVNYWDMFSVKELDRAPEWDGHTPAQAIERIQLLLTLG